MRSYAAIAHEPWGGDKFDFGHFRLDPDQKILWRDERVLPLGPKVVHTLAILLRHRGQVVARDELIREVWDGTVVEENSLAHNISVLRKALKEDGAYTIETIPRRGYRFCEAPPATLSIEEAAAASRPKLVDADFNISTKRPRHWLALAIMGGVLACLGAASAPLIQHHLLGQRGSRRSVAVIGFANLSHQPESGWLSQALSEMLATELAVGGNLLTVPDETVARARAELGLADHNGFSPDTLRRFRQNVNADVVISGAYAVLPNKHSAAEDPQVRLDLRLQDATSGETLDAVSEIGEQSSLFHLVARAGTRIRTDLGAPAVTPQQAVQAKASVSTNVQAVRLYAQGLEKLRSFDNLAARELLQQAVRKDPNYAAAHSALSESLANLGYERDAGEEARIAFELSAPLPREEQLSVEGRYLMATGDWPKALQVYKALQVSFPDDVDHGLNYAYAQIKASKALDALETLKNLRHLPPPANDDPRISLKEYRAWQSLGNFAQMERALEAAAESAKRRGALLLIARARIRQCWVQQFLAQPQQALNNCREAQEVYSSLGERRGEATALRLLGQLVSGSDLSAGVDYLQRALALDQEIGSLEEQASVTTLLATLQSGQGDHRGAEKSFQQVMEISQTTGNTLVATETMNNIAGEAKALGEIERARKMYADTLEAAEKINNEYLAAAVQYNSGGLEQSQGQLGSAEHSYRQALESFHRGGITKYDILINRSLGEIALLRGDLPNARTLYQTALATHPASAQKFQSAETEMDLDQLSLEQNQSSPAIESSLRRLADTFRHAGPTDMNNVIDDEAMSLSLLARCLLAEGKQGPALATMQQALSISRKAAPDIRLSVAVAAARIWAEPHADRQTEAAQSLRKTIAEAHHFGYVGVELEARLSLAEIELRSGATARARSHLQAVEKEASHHGLVLLARKAKAAA